MSDEKQLSQVHTTCRNCVFAKWDEGTQIGCKLNKLDDYKEAGIEVLDATDNELEFNVINGRFCVFYRNEQLMANVPRDNWEEIVKLQTKVPYHAILIVDEETDFRSIKESCKMLMDQDTSPNLVTIVNKQYVKYTEQAEGTIAPSKMLQLLQNCNFHQYSLKNIYDNQIDNRSCIDLVFDSTKEKPYPFYVVFKAGFDIPKNFSKELNDAILIKMMQIGFVKPIDEINGMIVNRIAHKKHSGNAFDRNIEDKILQFEENGEKFIFEIGDVCPSFKN